MKQLTWAEISSQTENSLHPKVQCCQIWFPAQSQSQHSGAAGRLLLTMAASCLLCLQQCKGHLWNHLVLPRESSTAQSSQGHRNSHQYLCVCWGLYRCLQIRFFSLQTFKAFSLSLFSLLFPVLLWRQMAVLSQAAVSCVQTQAIHPLQWEQLTLSAQLQNNSIWRQHKHLKWFDYIYTWNYLVCLCCLMGVPVAPPLLCASSQDICGNWDDTKSTQQEHRALVFYLVTLIFAKGKALPAEYPAWAPTGGSLCLSARKGWGELC